MTEINGVTPRDIAFRMIVESLEDWPGHAVADEYLFDEGIDHDAIDAEARERFLQEVYESWEPAVIGLIDRLGILLEDMD